MDVCVCVFVCVCVEPAKLVILKRLVNLNT